MTSLGENLDMIRDVLLDRGLLTSFTDSIAALSGLIWLQIFSFLASSIALLFLLWFVYRLYSIEEMNALTDPLTQLYNRRALMWGLKNEIERAEVFKHPLTIALLDIDYFKRYNDSFGHVAGDEVLKSIAKIIKNSIRETDFCGRIGGEEFLIIFPETNLMEASKICEEVRRNVEKYRFKFESRLSRKDITVSIGLAQYSPQNHKKSKEQFLDGADKRLYLAKLSGRNAVR